MMDTRLYGFLLGASIAVVSATDLGTDVNPPVFPPEVHNALKQFEARANDISGPSDLLANYWMAPERTIQELEVLESLIVRSANPAFPESVSLYSALLGHRTPSRKHLLNTLQTMARNDPALCANFSQQLDHLETNVDQLAILQVVFSCNTQDVSKALRIANNQRGRGLLYSVLSDNIAAVASDLLSSVKNEPPAEENTIIVLDVLGDAIESGEVSDPETIDRFISLCKECVRTSRLRSSACWALAACGEAGIREIGRALDMDRPEDHKLATFALSRTPRAILDSTGDPKLDEVIAALPAPEALIGDAACQKWCTRSPLALCCIGCTSNLTLEVGSDLPLIVPLRVAVVQEKDVVLPVLAFTVSTGWFSGELHDDNKWPWGRKGGRWYAEGERGATRYHSLEGLSFHRVDVPFVTDLVEHANQKEVVLFPGATGYILNRQLAASLSVILSPPCDERSDCFPWCGPVECGRLRVSGKPPR